MPSTVLRRHQVAPGLRGEIDLRLRALEARAHRVEIVLAEKQHGQLPQRGQIQRLVKLALGDGAVAEEARRDPRPLLHLVGEREPDRDREAAADDGVAAVEAGLRVEHVHRSAAAAAAALLLAVHLRHEPVGRDAARQRMTVLAVGRDDGIVWAECLHGADGDRFLADVQMQEAADLAGAVQLRALLLEAPDAQHLVQQAQPCSRESPHAVRFGSRSRRGPGGVRGGTLGLWWS